jgi:hypothetical protein
MPAMPLQTYRLRALLICHDVRLNTSVETQVALDHMPSEKEAILLLCPIADKEVARNYCEDCPYELYISVIEPIDADPSAI